MKYIKNGIKIVGGKNFINHYSEAISLVDKIGGKYSDLVYRNIRKILQGPFMFINILTGTYIRKGLAKLEWDASGLVHEAQHIEDFRNNPFKFLYRPTRENEKRALEVQDEFLRKMGQPKIDIETLLTTEWWNKPLFERNY